MIFYYHFESYRTMAGAVFETVRPAPCFVFVTPQDLTKNALNSTTTPYCENAIYGIRYNAYLNPWRPCLFTSTKVSNMRVKAIIKSHARRGIYEIAYGRYPKMALNIEAYATSESIIAPAMTINCAKGH